MINQTSIKYISGLLDNPHTLTDGDQSSIALFRQTFPYFVPARYLVALDAHKKSAHAQGMYTAIQPFLGDWMLFCDFLEASNKKVDGLAEVSKVVDKKKAEVHEPPVKPEVKDEPVVTILADRVAEAAKVYEVPQAPPPAPVVVEPVKEEIKEVAAVADEAKDLPVPEVIARVEEQVPAAELIADRIPVTETVQDLVPDAGMPKIVEVDGESLLHDMPVAFVAEAAVAAKAEGHITEVADIAAVVGGQAEATAEAAPVAEVLTIDEPGVVAEAAPGEDAGTISVISVPVEVAVFDTVPVAPVPVVIEEELAETEDAVAEAISETPEDDAVDVAPDVADEPVAIFPQDPEAVATGEAEKVAESGFARAWAEMEAQESGGVKDKPIDITPDDTEPAITFTETGDEEHDPLIFPIYTRDYFLQQGEKVSDEIPLEINELRDMGGESDEDKSLMVVMSFSEWLLHFKSTSERQREETKDQKALKTMWQKEKLAAAIEEENEEIPETVFEMAVNSISKEEGLVSESLADIYIKQGKYDRAIEMYRKLSLRNPQKSAYFARKIEEALKDKQS